MRIKGRCVNQYTKLHRRIEDIRQQLAALTPGPWFAANMTGQCWELYQDCDTHKRPLCRRGDNSNVETDLRFAAAARQHIEWLCEELSRALKAMTAAEIEHLTGALAQVDDPSARELRERQAEARPNPRRVTRGRRKPYDQDSNGGWSNAVRAVEDRQGD